MVIPTYQHVIARAGFTLRGAPGTLGIFATSFCQILVKSKEMSYPLSAGNRALCHLLNPAVHYVHKKG